MAIGPPGLRQGRIPAAARSLVAVLQALAYSSSYQIAPCTYDLSPPGARIQQAYAECDAYMCPSAGILENRARVADVWFPSQKVLVYDRHQRHFGSQKPFFGLPQCRQPLLAFDGSVTLRLTAQTNRGWRPNEPASPQPTTVWYMGFAWDIDPITEPHDVGFGHYRWTRGGLAGVDWGGNEIDTGQMK